MDANGQFPHAQRVRALVDLFWNGTNMVAVPAGSEGTMIVARYPTPSNYEWVSWSVDGMGVYKQALPDQFEIIEDSFEEGREEA